jgi:hypothetical protein
MLLREERKLANSRPARNRQGMTQKTHEYKASCVLGSDTRRRIANSRPVRNRQGMTQKTHEYKASCVLGSDTRRREGPEGRCPEWRRRAGRPPSTLICSQVDCSAAPPRSPSKPAAPTEPARRPAHSRPRPLQTVVVQKKPTRGRGGGGAIRCSPDSERQ